MTDQKTVVLTTHSAKETKELAEKIATNVRGGEVIELVSDLGGGKTTFTQGFVHGLGSSDNVASPTFTISREYTGGTFHVYHFDFYRLQDAGIIADELAEVISDKRAIVVVEWGDIVQNVLPKSRIQITITAVSEYERRLTCKVPAELSYIIQGVIC
jgi:tRNA threonylcarbamoyladenosine biosynthesis protein TsaE